MLKHHVMQRMPRYPRYPCSVRGPGIEPGEQYVDHPRWLVHHRVACQQLTTRKLLYRAEDTA